MGDCRLTSIFQNRHESFTENPGKFWFGEDFMEYFLGFPEYTLPWNTVDVLYLPLNIQKEHWVLCVVHLQEWRIDVYDCDQTVYPGERFEACIQPLCEMIPYFLVEAMLSEQEKARYPKLSVTKLDFHRIPHPTLPKATSSGDCGFFL